MEKASLFKTSEDVPLSISLPPVLSYLLPILPFKNFHYPWTQSIV